MKKLGLSVAISAAVLLPLLCGVPAQAQATRTWISGVGDDVNPCSRTAPCKTFPGAISKTAAGGEINCLDPGGFGGVTITKSITLDCSGTFGSILVNGTPGITINADSAPSVRIRGISINGAGTTLGTNGIRIIGSGASIASSQVLIENVVIDQFSQRGISDERNGGKLLVTNTTVRNTTQTCIVILPGVAAALNAVFNNVRAFACGNGGLAVNNNAQAVVTNSVFSDSSVGVDVESGAIVDINSSVISGNATGFFLTSTLRLGNSDVAFNATLTSGGSAINSYSNNRFSNNGAGTITAIGSTSNPTGQQ
jgi:hypothetical protein